MEPIPEKKQRKPYKTKPVEDKKTGDIKSYNRAYKKQQYRSNPEKSKATSRINYYRYKYNLTLGEMEEYGSLVPDVAKLLDSLRKIRDENEDLIEIVLQRFKTEPRMITQLTEKVIVSNEIVPLENVEIV